MRRFLFKTIHDMALMLDGERAGSEASPSGGVLDSRSVKAPAPGAKRGFDAGEKILGRKRWPWVKHLLADGASNRTELMEKNALRDFVIEAARRIDKEPCFKVLPRR